MIRYAFPSIMLSAKRLEQAGDYAAAQREYYRAHRIALYSLFCGVQTQEARSAQEGRYRCYRAIRAALKGASND